MSLWDTPSEYFQLEYPRRPFPVMPFLSVKKKGEAPKCKTCKRFYDCTKSHGTMIMACDRYERKKEKEMKFNSQICTTRSQSEALLKLGLKKETADMYYSYDIICAKPYYKVMEFMNGCVPEDIFPAWSLHRLIEMLTKYGINVTFINNIVVIDRHQVFQKSYEFWDDVYDNFCDAIEWLIKEGYFNEEYLEE